MDPLVKSAQDARKNARAPYSGYTVGAAVETSDGIIIQGCNIEVSSLGLTSCAERVALTSAAAQGYRSFTSLAVATRDGAAPCGACRQLIWDLCGDIPILLIDDKGQVETVKLSQLFPHPFDEKNLTPPS